MNPKQTTSLPRLTTSHHSPGRSSWTHTFCSEPPSASPPRYLGQSDKSIHKLFEAQVSRTPEAVALKYEDQELSYRQLNQCADRLALRLRGLGVAAETLVGLCMERSIETVIGIL